MTLDRETGMLMDFLLPLVPSRYGFLLTVAFKVYDMDRDGYISNGELYLVLKQMVGNNLKVSPVTGVVRDLSYVVLTGSERETEVMDGSTWKDSQC